MINALTTQFMKIISILQEATTAGFDMDSNVKLYRGTDQEVSAREPTVVRGPTVRRNSLTTSNIAMVALSIAAKSIPQLRGLPDRGMSTFASNELTHARHFGWPCELHVKRGTPIGWVEGDFNDQQLKIRVIGQAIKAMSMVLNVPADKIRDLRTTETITSLIAYIDQQISLDPNARKDFIGITEGLGVQANTVNGLIVKIFQNIVDKQRIGLVNNTSELPTDKPIEVWFEGDYVLTALPDDDRDDDRDDF